MLSVFKRIIINSANIYASARLYEEMDTTLQLLQRGANESLYIYISGAYRDSQSGLSHLHQFFTPIFYNSKILPVKQYFSAIKYYHKHL